MFQGKADLTWMVVCKYYNRVIVKDLVSLRDPLYPD